MSSPTNPDCQFEQESSHTELVDAQIAYLQQNNIFPNPDNFVWPETAAEHQPLEGILHATQPSAVYPPSAAEVVYRGPVTTYSPNGDDFVFQPLFTNNFPLHNEYVGEWMSVPFELDNGFWSTVAGNQTLQDNRNNHSQLQNGDTTTTEHPRVAEEKNNSGMSSTPRHKREAGSPGSSKLHVVFRCLEPNCPKYYTTKAGLDYHTRVSTSSNVACPAGY